MVAENGNTCADNTGENTYKMKNIGQIIGFFAMAVSVLIYLQRKRRNILALKLTTDVLWAMHHLLILSYSAATTTIAIFREIVFYNYDKKWAKSKWWGIGFSMTFILASLLTWKDAFSIIPAFGTILTTIAFGNKKHDDNKNICVISFSWYDDLWTAL